MNESMTPSAAARVLADAAGFEEALQRRSEGLTLMVWGLVGPAIFLTYSAAALWEGTPGWAFSVIWIPWVFAGGATVGMLWRSAGLSAPQMTDPIGARGYAWRFLALVAAIALVFELWDPRHHAAPLLVIGAMYVFFGLVNLFYISRPGRVLYGAIGVAFVAAAAVLVALPETGWTFVATLLVGGLLPLVGGYVHSLRG